MPDDPGANSAGDRPIYSVLVSMDAGDSRGFLEYAYWVHREGGFDVVIIVMT